MSAKKIGIVTAILIVAIGGIFGGWNLLEQNGNSEKNLSADTPTENSDMSAEDEAAVEAGGQPETNPLGSSNDVQLASDEPPVDQNDEIEEDGSSEGAGATLAKARREHGKIEDPDKYVTISGMVVDEKGNGVSAAKVMAQAAGYTLDEASHDNYPAREAIRDSRHHFMAVTDASGAYTVKGIQYEGAMLVQAAAPGYSKRDASNVVLEVEPGDSLEEVDIVLIPGVTAFGRVISSSGLPVDDGQIALLGWSRPGTSSSGEMVVAYTDAEGRFSLSLDDDGVATILVRSPKFGVSSFPGIPIEDGRDEIELRMRDTASLVSSIRWPDGSPANGVEVSLTGWFELRGSLREGPSTRRLSDTQGMQEFAQTDPGLFYRIELRGEDGKALSPRIDIGALEPGEERLWDYVIEQPIVVYGTVFGKLSGKPIQNVMVDVRAGDFSPGGSDDLLNRFVDVDSQGQYELNILSGPGEYHVFAKRRWDTRAAEAYAAGETIALNAGDERELNLTMEDAFTMSIQLVDIAGNPVEGEAIVIHQGGGTDSDSRMRTDVEGRFTWSGFRAGESSGLSIIRRGQILASSSIVVGEPGEIVPEELLVLHQYGGIEGLAMDASGNPIRNAEIEILVAFGNGQNRTLRLTTDDLGEFVTLDRIPATEVYIDMRITAAPDGIPTSFTWQSDLMAIPAEQVVLLGAVPFAPGESPAPSQKSLMALHSE